MLNYLNLDVNKPFLRQKFTAGRPFKNIIIDDFLEPEYLSEIVQEFQDSNWGSYKHFNENKQCIVSTFPKRVTQLVSELNSHKFLNILEDITGIGNLIPDTLMRSGGMHRSSKGSFLNIHADFTVHPNYKNWERKLNVLIYLSPTWSKDWGGGLELWSCDVARCEKIIDPNFNRAVIFETSHDSFHGHPEPIQCPDGMYRNSLALYYYVKSDNVSIIPTNYQSRPGDSVVKSFFIYLDKQLVKGYHLFKMLTNKGDDLGVKVLSLLSKKKNK